MTFYDFNESNFAAMLYFTYYTKLNIPGPILESKGMRASFQKKGKKKGKKWQKIWKFWQKMYKIWSYFEKYALYTNFKHGDTRESFNTKQ